MMDKKILKTDQFQKNQYADIVTLAVFYLA